MTAVDPRRVALGWLPKKRVAMPESLRAPHVTEVWSAAPCIAHPADRSWDPDEPLNGAAAYDTPEDAARAAAASEGGPFVILGFVARPVVFETNGTRTIDPHDVFGDTSRARMPSDTDAYGGFDVVRFDGRFDCAPLTCNGLAAERPCNRHGLFDDEAEARAFGEEMARVGLYEPPPFYLVEVWCARVT